MNVTHTPPSQHKKERRVTHMATQPLMSYESALKNAHTQQRKYQLPDGRFPEMVIVGVTLHDEAEPRFRVYQKKSLAVSLKKAANEIDTWEILAWVRADGSVEREASAHYWDEHPLPPQGKEEIL